MVGQCKNDEKIPVTDKNPGPTVLIRQGCVAKGLFLRGAGKHTDMHTLFFVLVLALGLLDGDDTHLGNSGDIGRSALSRQFLI